ncbi:unnamed protein product [Meganyctiphanes norvegica]|uniref:FAD-binding domain-containing protein n=1 Tax=Meganyctiphanes norvegica TaxID=48144 RepID=A0AAV2Q9F2_MEGNR
MRPLAVAPVTPPGVGNNQQQCEAGAALDQLCTAEDLPEILQHHLELCNILTLKPNRLTEFYHKLRDHVKTRRAQNLWNKFDEYSRSDCYNNGTSCSNLSVLVIGAGPCGLRTAIEAQLLGAKVVVVEKRTRFTRNNVLQMWPFVIEDLRKLGAKDLYPRFAGGTASHISIRRMQSILAKIALLLGVEIFPNTSYQEIVEPSADKRQETGWQVRVSPDDHRINSMEFNVIIGADGRHNTLPGFTRREYRPALAIAITANFINKRTQPELKVPEIGGLHYMYNQRKFKRLEASCGIALENIIYYKDETHYFVMTAKKQSLLNKGVIQKDLGSSRDLLQPSNINRNALQGYVREAVDFFTDDQFPILEFELNHHKREDVAIFDFTSMFCSENASCALQKRGHTLLLSLVGDSLLEPFWPQGTGCGRGFLSALDTCWLLKRWAADELPLQDAMAEREAVYKLLQATVPRNLSQKINSYTLDPYTRYKEINLKSMSPSQVAALIHTDNPS